MPLRPALGQPPRSAVRYGKSVRAGLPAMREVRCPHCGKAFQISSRAISGRCPACTRPMQFEDVQVRRHTQGDVTTMGHVHIARQGEIVGRVACGQLLSEGNFNGTAKVHGMIELGRHSDTRGELVATSIRVVRGAQVRGRLCIGANVARDSVVKREL